MNKYIIEYKESGYNSNLIEKIKAPNLCSALMKFGLNHKDDNKIKFISINEIKNT